MQLLLLPLRILAGPTVGELPARDLALGRQDTRTVVHLAIRPLDQHLHTEVLARDGAWATLQIPLEPGGSQGKSSSGGSVGTPIP
eukprot:14676330-Alexandrium_andersonii.AAC.1